MFSLSARILPIRRIHRRKYSKTADSMSNGEPEATGLGECDSNRTSDWLEKELKSRRNLIDNLSLDGILNPHNGADEVLLIREIRQSV